MPRLLFEKKGNAVWISHLDLMRMFQRAFKRAGLALTHTQGFNPRPSVSIALPMSVGIESVCELLDFDLDVPIGDDEILNRLNSSLISGIRVLSVYNDGNKIKNLSLMHCRLVLEYDSGIPEAAESAICQLLSRDTVTVEKKNKNGTTEQNIIPMIRRYTIVSLSPKELCMDAVICCQNPTLNPMQIPAAIARYIPEYSPDFVRCSRIELYDENENVFR